MNEIKRHFYNGEHYTIDYASKTVTLNEEFKQKLANKNLWGKFGFKKIGGSSVGDVLEVSQFSSLFGAFCRLTWIGLPILDRKYVDAGIDIEPMVVEAIESMTGKKVTTYDPYAYQFDFFKGKDDVMGGLPDGFIEEEGLLLEIKTTGAKNFDKWKQYGVPANYLKQAQLYAYLMGVSKYSIVATFLQPEDYADPKSYPIRQRKLKNWLYEVNVAQAEDDILKAKNWYYKVTASGVSPQWDEMKDKDLLKWIECKNRAEVDQLLTQWELEGKYVK